MPTASDETRQQIQDLKKALMEEIASLFVHRIDHMLSVAFNNGWDAGYEAALKKKEG